MSRPRVTACVITRNEEGNLPDCLRSVAGLCDHVVVVDCGSSDGTVAIARDAGATVIETDWPGHVAQKNRAIDAATTDWVLCLDADERVSAELAGEITSVLDAGPTAAAYSMPRLTRYLGRWIRHGGWYPDRKVRLFDRRRARWGGIDPHDRVEVEPGAPIVALRGDLHHHTYRDLSDHLGYIDRYTSTIAREKQRRGERFRLHRMLLRPVGKVLRMYVLRGGFLDGPAGLIVALLGGYYVFLKYAKLWELERGDA